MEKITKIFTSCHDGNLAFHVGDDINNVLRNHHALGVKYGIKMDNLRHMNQVHSNHIEIVTHDSKKCLEKCDAIITKESNIPLMVMVADCIPILMYDEKKGAIAAIHAGRNSTFLNIAQLTAQKMMDEFGCEASDIHVELGPSIQKCCYEVSEELACIVKTSFGEEFVNGRLIDLQGINIQQLNEVGVTNIEVSSVCTKCSNEPYFSYRKDKNTGRFAGVIVLS